VGGPFWAASGVTLEIFIPPFSFRRLFCKSRSQHGTWTKITETNILPLMNQSEEIKRLSNAFASLAIAITEIGNSTSVN
jgi:hypothetical protein